jgi:hypothetical protein
LLQFLLPFLKGQQLIIFPEGASCFNDLIKNYKFFIRKKLSKYIKKIIIGHYQIKRAWILSDRDGQAKSLISKKSIHKVFSHKVFFSNIKKCSRYFKKKYSELNICNEKKIFFHPAIQYLNRFKYKKWIESYYEVIGKNKLIIKAHEHDYRDYRKVFEKFNYVIIPKKFITLPAELIIEGLSTKYFGYYSTIMLHYKKEDINFLTPNDKKLLRLAEKEFFGLKHLMNV